MKKISLLVFLIFLSSVCGIGETTNPSNSSLSSFDSTKINHRKILTDSLNVESNQEYHLFPSISND